MHHLFVLIILIMFALLPNICMSENDSVTQVATIILEDKATVSRQLLGTIVAVQQQTLASQIAGVVSSNRIAMGQEVKAGEVIIQLDNREALAQVKLAEAEVSMAMIAVEQKQLAFNRTEKTYHKKVVSAAIYDVARLDLQHTQKQLAVVQVKLQLAELHLEKHSIKAPFDAVLMQASPVIGKQVLPGENLLSILNVKKLLMSVDLSPQELFAIQQQDSLLQIKENNRLLTLAEFSPTAHSKTGMVKVQFALAKINTGVHHVGQVVSLQLIKPQLDVPKHLVIKQNKESYVLVANHGVVARRNLNSLQVGDEIIVMHHADLLPGDRIKTISLGH